MPMLRTSKWTATHRSGNWSEAGIRANGLFRWTAPIATARLTRPADAKQFELTVNIGPGFSEYVQHSHVVVALNGDVIGERDFTPPGWQTVRWNLDNAPSRACRSDQFDTHPSFAITGRWERCWS